MKPAVSCVALFGIVAAFYLALLSHGDMALIAPERLDGAFDSMLQHLLRGDVGVDASAIGYESFTRDGRTLSYFGIVPALLRIPALLLGPADPNQMHLARLSCLIASVAYVFILLATLRMAHLRLPLARRSVLPLVLVATCLVFSGTHVTLLSSAYVYSEPVMWGAVFAALFNLIVIRVAFARRWPSGAELATLAILAGLALNTRPTTGIDLAIGLSLILGSAALARYRGLATATSWRAMIVAVAIMGLGAGIVALVNEARWGSPLTFANWSLQDILRHHAERWSEYQHNGDFNIRRIPVSFIYYATGIPYVLKNFGAVGAQITGLYDVIEGPPTSPILTGPLWLLLALVGVRSTLRQGSVVVAALVGHATSALLLLCAMAITLRYREDFAPLLALPAVFGYIAVSDFLARSASRVRRRVFTGLVALGVIGILGSQYVLLMAKVLNPAVPVAVRCRLHGAAPFLPINNPDGPLPPDCKTTSSVAQS